MANPSRLSTNSFGQYSHFIFFLSQFEGGLSDASEMTVDGERLIRTDFSMMLKGYVIPQFTNTIVTGKTSEIIRNIGPSRVVFGFEGDATDFQVGKK